MWDGKDFSGTKVALICGELTVAYLRDDKIDIPFPGMWDLPGGGRDGKETPIECGLREVEEEFGLRLSPSDVFMAKRCESRMGGLDTYFCAVRISHIDIASVQFGSEGQRWKLMPVSEFVQHKNAVPDMKVRLQVAVETGIAKAEKSGFKSADA
jgi:8-oxo-dGTP diphosphatase